MPRWLGWTVAAAVSLSSFAFADESAKPPADPARIAAARDLLQVTGVTAQIEGMVTAMKDGFAKGAKAEDSAKGQKLKEEFDATMNKLMSYREDMLTDFAVLYAETFTAEEMKTVADFYRSGTGAKFIALTPELMKKGSVIGMKYSERIAREMRPAPR